MALAMNSASISENIRQLAKEGLSVAEIAERLGIRYQHAYGVVKANDGVQPRKSVARPPLQPKPILTADFLIQSGFDLSAYWTLTPNNELVLDRPVSRSVGVYAFAIEGIVHYVGVATMGLSKRLYFYGKPGATQLTSLRLNSTIKNALAAVLAVEIYTAEPPDLEWNGLPIHGSAGLELGLIKKFDLPWNKRSSGR
jgi:hypothetical protein